MKLKCISASYAGPKRIAEVTIFYQNRAIYAPSIHIYSELAFTDPTLVYIQTILAVWNRFSTLYTPRTVISHHKTFPTGIAFCF